MKICSVCKTKVQKNMYWRALDAGARYYCPKCDMHLHQDIHNKLFGVILKCNCCGWSDASQVNEYNLKVKNS